LAQANRRIAEAHQLDLFDRDQLGFFVVSRLAKRQNISVTLRRSAYGGTTVVVLLPNAILSQPGFTWLTESGNILRQPAMVSAPSMRADPEPGEVPVKKLPPVPVGAPETPSSVTIWPTEEDPAGGLPRRIRQASLAPGLRETEPGGVDDTVVTPPIQSSPEQARATMSALQQGFHRGRDE
jgi:hypothetical protein